MWYIFDMYQIHMWYIFDIWYICDTYLICMWYICDMSVWYISNMYHICTPRCPCDTYQMCITYVSVWESDTVSDTVSDSLKRWYISIWYRVRHGVRFPQKVSDTVCDSLKRCPIPLICITRPCTSTGVSHIYIYICAYVYKRVPPKNGEIALLLTTNSLMCSKYVSQKQNEAIDNFQWYNMTQSYIVIRQQSTLDYNISQ